MVDEWEIVESMRIDCWMKDLKVVWLDGLGRRIESRMKSYSSHKKDIGYDKVSA